MDISQGDKNGLEMLRRVFLIKCRSSLETLPLVSESIEIPGLIFRFDEKKIATPNGHMVNNLQFLTAPGSSWGMRELEDDELYSQIDRGPTFIDEQDEREDIMWGELGI